MTLETRPLMIFHTLYINWRMRMLHSKNMAKMKRELEKKEFILYRLMTYLILPLYMT